ncbi:alpha/beta hydrolase [Enterococcus hirae]|uniref:Alpha/beta hydrolase fold-3 domain-containing protein n=1 Tax=Candidatus Enterococcus wittei TaxID=1987383 RepID=A0A242K0H8_9ENTE|nr:MULTISPECIES: alpha/beta hydrolase [Enterococcus]MBO1117555.1 alpha/beta hydrolase [Enterococcus hirae]OTP11167.1 hypothetical protein A5844_001301 [Enterococcus sp. 10A9_DIV0425]THE13556.1 alpha/beta hydrolase [Enterococcus hirae]
MKETKQLANGLSVTIYPAAQETPKYIFYFHGGGLIYGSKNDLPESLKELFVSKGYTILALDYLLAPNSSLEEIIGTLIESFNLLKDTLIQNQPFGFCGRSAGSYLMFQLAKYLTQKQQAPKFLINFYGYTDFNYLQKQSPLITHQITETEISTIDQHTKVADDPLFTRVLLYHYGNQHGCLPEYYGLLGKEEEKFTIQPADLIHFPPCFSTASTTDKEIPFSYSKKISKQIPNSTFYPVYDLEHDFLKQTKEPQVQEVLTKLADWLHQTTNF